jgi:hypothetical protein
MLTVNMIVDNKERGNAIGVPRSLYSLLYKQ